MPLQQTATTPTKYSRLSQMISQMGPGIVYILTVLGAGDLVSNSAAGAGYGYALIWTVVLGMIFRFTWVNVSAKYVLVTGETLMHGFAKVGQWTVWLILISMIVMVHGYNMYMIVVSGDAISQLFPLTELSTTIWSTSFTLSSPGIWSLFFATVAFFMAYWGGYWAIEIFCKVLVGIMGASLVLVAFLSDPDPTQIAKGLFIPSIPKSQGLYDANFMLMALFGTMTGSIVNMTYAYFIYEKGWRTTSHLKQQRFDLLTGVTCACIMGILLQVAAAATIHPLGVDLKDSGDMVRIFSEVQGIIGKWIFGLGLWGAAFSTLIGTTVGCALIVADLFRFLNKNPEEGKRGSPQFQRIYRICVIFWSFSPLYILLTGVSPVFITLAVSALVVGLVPILTIILMKITSEKSIMGKHRNTWITNALLICLTLVGFYMIYANLFR